MVIRWQRLSWIHSGHSPTTALFNDLEQHRVKSERLRERMDLGMDLAGLHSFMVRHRYGVVSTVATPGVPQSALVGIATTPDLEIIFDTLRSTRKYANLIARPGC